MTTITELGKDTDNTEKNVRLLTRYINLTVYIFDYQHITRKTYTNQYRHVSKNDKITNNI